MSAQDKPWTVLVQFVDDCTGKLEAGQTNGRRYATREAADKAAARLEARNMANGADCACTPILASEAAS